MNNGDFWSLLKKQGYQFGSSMPLTDLTGHPAEKLAIPHGTTIFSFKYKDGVLAPTAKMADQMEKFLVEQGTTASLPLTQAVQIALRTWAISLIPSSRSETKEEELPKKSFIDSLLKEKLPKLTLEVAVLDKSQPGTSKYRSLSKKENQSFLKEWIK